MPMKKQKAALKQIRLSDENYNELVSAKRDSIVRVSMGALGNSAIAIGLRELRRGKLLTPTESERKV